MYNQAFYYTYHTAQFTSPGAHAGEEGNSVSMVEKNGHSHPLSLKRYRCSHGSCSIAEEHDIAS